MLNAVGFRQWVLAGALLVIFALLYDAVSGTEPCTLCVLQRMVLVFTVGMMWLFSARRLVIGAYALGILLGIRHLYILLFAPVATGCLPLSMLDGLPWAAYPSFLLTWLSQVGQQCGETSTLIDLMFLGMLLAYYIMGMLLSRHVTIGSLVYERI